MRFSSEKNGRYDSDAHKNPMTGVGQIGRKAQNGEDESEYIEDTTLYPEFIPTFDNWISYDKQKRRTKQLEDMGNNNTKM